MNSGEPRLTSSNQKPSLVFISAKSQDYRYAQQVHKFLVDHGVRAFFSNESLLKKGDSSFHKVIENALENAGHMIVVVSKADYANSPWVESEWRSFINEKLSGRKHGNLLTLTIGNLKSDDLPLTLRNYEIIQWDRNALEKVLHYVKEIAEVSPSTLSFLIVSRLKQFFKKIFRYIFLTTLAVIVLSIIGAVAFWLGSEKKQNPLDYAMKFIFSQRVIQPHKLVPLSPSKDPPPAPTAIKAILRISSSPPGRVYLDDRLVSETTPFKAAIEKGKHKIEIKQEGYEPYQEVLILMIIRISRLL